MVCHWALNFADMHRHDHLLADGPDRCRAAMRPKVVAAVRAEFAERLARASLLGRVRLHFAMRREIRRRLNAVVSPKAL